MSPQAARSFRLLWWVVLGPIVGFMLGSLFSSESWPLWQVIPLALLLAAPFAVGAFYGVAQFAAMTGPDGSDSSFI